MIIRNKTAGLSLAAIAAAGIVSAACAGGTATADQVADTPTAEEQVTEKKVVTKRIVRESVSDDGEVKRSEKVIILDGADLAGDADLEFFGDDGTHKVIKIKRTGGHAMHMAHCVGGDDDENPPVKFEWKDESEDGERVDISVICLTGDEAAPENQAEALEKAIAHLEAQGAADAERRARAIESMRSKLEELKAGE